MDRRPVQGESKTLIERKRLTFFDTVEVLGITLKLQLVPSGKNPADELSRIPAELKLTLKELEEIGWHDLTETTEFEAYNHALVLLATIHELGMSASQLNP